MVSEQDVRYEMWLRNASREELVERIRNQRTEINNLARNYNAMIHTAGEHAFKIRQAVNRLKKGQHLTALWHLTDEVTDSNAILRELAGDNSRGDISAKINPSR